MKPVIILCVCNFVTTIVAVQLFHNYDLHFMCYCANCNRLVRWETTLEKLAIKADNIPPLPIPLAAMSDEQFLAELKITEPLPEPDGNDSIGT